MQLNYVASSGAFTLAIDNPADRQRYMREHGLNWSKTDGLLYTREPYAAVPFWQHATPAAQAQLLDLQTRIDDSWKLSSDAHIACPPDQELAPFQKAGVEYALGQSNTLIGDQPGLGKTMQAICFANEIQARRVLVIVPAAIRLQWCKRIRTWTTMRWPFVVYPILSAKHGVHPEAQWTVVSYDLAKKPSIWQALAAAKMFDLLIIDEGHYLKETDAQRTRTVFGRYDDEATIASPLSSRAARILDMSGTPIPNRPREAYSAARGLCFEAVDFMSKDKFDERFNPSGEEENRYSGEIYRREESGRHAELQARLRANFMVRRLKKDVQPQLKLPLIEVVHVEETGEVRKALAAERLLDIDPQRLEGLNSTIIGEIATVRRMMGLAIAPLAVDYIRMLIEGGEDKLFVAAYHTQVIALLHAKLHHLAPTWVIDGSTPPGRRQKAVDDFSRAPRGTMIGQILAIGTGTDGLQQTCSRGVCAEPDWVPGVNEQLVNRLDRMGQTDRVLFSFLVAPNSFSERVLGTSLEKAEGIDRALDRRLV